MSTAQKVGYVRVSSEDQNTERQVEQLNAYGCTKLFTDKLSGKDTNRPALQELLSYVREGDSVVVASLDRLGRSLIDVRQLVDTLVSKGCCVHFLKENLTFDTAQADAITTLMFNMLVSFAEFERTLIRERQREGIAIAKREGKYKGGTPKLTPKQAQELCQRVTDGASVTLMASEYGISRKTVYEYLKASSEAS